jgi:hypothetical protein
MDLPCQRCIDLAYHCDDLFTIKSVSLGICNNTCGLPRLKMRSKLVWKPTLVHICVFPIEEDVDVDEVGFASLHPHRPLFYSEIDAVSYRALKWRLKVKKCGF